MTNLKISGKVLHGKGLGRKFGMPTANVSYKSEQDLPKFGVYASRVFINDEKFIGVTNVGLRPSVDNDNIATVEVHILDFDRMIYDQTITVEFVQYLRPIIKFSGLDKVKAQVDKDIAKTRQLNIK